MVIVLVDGLKVVDNALKEAIRRLNLIKMSKIDDELASELSKENLDENRVVNSNDIYFLLRFN